MSNIVGLPSVSDSPKTTFFVGDIQKLSTDKVDVTLYNGTPFSLSSARKKYSGELYIAEVKYRTDDYVAGLELSYDIQGFKVVDIAYRWKDKDSQLNIKNYITQVSKSNKKIISYFNPDITSMNILESTDYIAKNVIQNETALFVILEKTSENNYFKITEKFKAVKNLDSTGTNILESVPQLSKWDVNIAFGPEALKNPSYIKRAAQMAITELYDENIDIDSSLNTIDVLDIVGLCNHRWYSLNHDANAVNNRIYVPSYVEFENSHVSKTDLVDADLKIKNVDFQFNDSSFDLAIDIGFNASVTAHGWQFDIGRNWGSYSFINKEDNSLIKPNVVFKGQLEELKEFYDYRVVSIDNRFGYDNITRISVYRKPFNGEDPSALVDVSRQNILLNSHGTEPRKYSETILRLEWNNIKKVSNLSLLPKKEFYIKKNTESFSDLIQDNIDTYKKGERWYGSVNYDQETSTWYTGETFNPYSSVELEVKWDLFGMLNRKAITNSNLSFIKHYSRTEQDLVNFSYQFAYPEEGPTAELGVLEKYGNDFQAYAESVLGYVNSTIMNGLSSGTQSKYDYEPIVPDGYLAGYMNDHDLSGTKNIVDTSALSNLFTIRISTNADGDSQEVITSNAVKNIIDNRIVPGEKTSNDVPGKRVYTSSAVEKKILDSLNKIVPTLIINENNTLTYPEIVPSTVDKNIDSSTIFFTEAKKCNPANLPREFRSWKQYFSEIYDIAHSDIPEADEFVFFQINASSNSVHAGFLKSVTVDMQLNAYCKINKIDGSVYNEYDPQTPSDMISLVRSKSFGESHIYPSTILGNNPGGEYNIEDYPTFTYGGLEITFDNQSYKNIATTEDGGTLNIISVFMHGPNIDEYQEGPYFSSHLGGDTSITWSKVPSPQSLTDLITHDTLGENLFTGPGVTYKSYYLKDNSTSHRSYDEVDLYTQVENKREITIKSLGAAAYQNGSFTLVLNEQSDIDIDVFSSSFGHDVPTKQEGGLCSWDIAYSSSSDITGSVEVARIKFSEDIFEEDMDDADPNVEVIYPPIGVNKTLLTPFIDETNIYPSWERCLLHADASDSNYVRVNSGNEVLSFSNEFSSEYFDVFDYTWVSSLYPTNSVETITSTRPLYNKEGFDGNKNSLHFRKGDRLQIATPFEYRKSAGEIISFDIGIDINYEDFKNTMLTSENTIPSEGRSFLEFEVAEESWLDNNLKLRVSHGQESQFSEEAMEGIVEALGSSNSLRGFWENFFASGSIFALKEELDSTGATVRSLITQSDVDNGHVIDNNTKYFLNAWGNWFYDSDGQPDSDEGFYTEEELLTDPTILNAGGTDPDFPDWYFTVNEDGSFYIRKLNDNRTWAEEQNSGERASYTIIDLFASFLSGNAGYDADDDLEERERADNRVPILADILAFLWNDKNKTKTHIKPKDEDGNEIYLSYLNGIMLAPKDREYIRADLELKAPVPAPPRESAPGFVYLPSKFEIINNNYLTDSNKELLEVPYHIRVTMNPITQAVDLNINSKSYFSFSFPDDDPFNNSSGDFFNPLVSFGDGDSFVSTVTIGYNVRDYWTVVDDYQDHGGIDPNPYVYTTVNSQHISEYSYDNLEFHFGEILFFNRKWDHLGKEAEQLSAVICNRWGFGDNLSPNNRFYGEDVNTVNAVFTNEEIHPDKLAIDTRRDYQKNKNFKTDSSRFSSKIIERKLQITNASFDSLDMSTFNSRQLPAGFELASPSESKVYVSKWDEERGMLHVSYRSNKKIDAFQIEIGNFIDNPEEYLLIKDATGVGIIDTYKSDIMDKRKWGTPIIGKGPGNYPHEKVNKIIYAVAPDLNLDPEGPYPNRALGSWPLPATTRGAATELCIIKVDPKAFKGAPIIENFSLVSNDSLTIPDAGFDGSTSSDLIISRSGSLQEIEDLVRSGFYYTNSGSMAQVYLANKYDASGNNYVDVTDYISVRNHITLNGEAVNQGNNFVPLAYTSSYALLPDYTFSSSLSDDISALSASLSWTPNGPGADSFQIWRRSFNVNNQSAASGKWELLTSLSGSSWLDQEPPINRLAEQQEDNPEFEYLLVASNEHGTSTYNSQTFQFPPYFNGDLLVNDISVTTYKGKEVVIMPSYYDNNSAAPPFGNNTDNPSNFEFNFGPPDKAAGKFIKEATQNIFHFDPDYSNFVGRLTGTYEVVNTRTGDWKEGQYVINVLPKPFDLEYSQTKIVDAYSNVIYFDLNDVGSVDYVALQRTATPGSWAGSRVGEWIKTKDLENNIVRIEDIIDASDFGDFTTSQTFYYRILAYEDINDDSDLDQGTDLEILSNVLTVVCASREKLETYTFSAPTANSCTSPNPTVTFQIPQLTSSLNTFAKSYSVERVDGSDYTVADVYHNTGSNPIDVSLDVDKVAGCNELYFRSFRVVGLSEDLMTTEYNVITASLDKCPNTPVAKSVTVKACLNEEFQGDLKTYLSNASEDVSLASFVEVGSLIGLTLNSDGTFSYTPTSVTSVSFDYTGTSCGVTSNTGTITFEVSDECVLCPDEQEEVICRYAKVNQEYPEFAGHTPLKYKDRNVSNIRLRELQEDYYKVSSNKS